MTSLIRPDDTLFAPWRAMVEEFGGDFPHGSGLTPGTGEWLAIDRAAFGELVARLRREGHASVPPPRDPVSGRQRVHCDFFWIADGADEGAGTPELVGFLALRRELNQWLLDEGGHIGYSVRPSRRREGHARRALGLGVRRAAALGIERVLVTCDEDNEGSRRTIEAGGGVYEDSRNGKRRYWIDTGSRS